MPEPSIQKRLSDPLAEVVVHAHQIRQVMQQPQRLHLPDLQLRTFHRIVAEVSGTAAIQRMAHFILFNIGQILPAFPALSRKNASIPHTDESR